MTTKKRQASQKIDLKTDVKTNPRKWICYCAALVLVVGVIPMIVNCQSGGEYLAYLGAVFGAATALIVAPGQAHSDEKARKEEREQSAKPTIWVGVDTDFEKHHAYDLDASSRDELAESQDQQLRMDLKSDADYERDYIVLASQDGEWQLGPRGHKSPDERFCQKAHCVDYYDFSGGENVTCSPYYSIPLVIMNAGAAPAFNFRPGIRLRGEESVSCLMPPSVLDKGDEDRVVIAIDASSISGKTPISFDFTVTFETILGTSFRSVMKVEFKDDGEGHRSHSLKFVPEMELVEISDLDCYLINAI